MKFLILRSSNLKVSQAKNDLDLTTIDTLILLFTTKNKLLTFSNHPTKKLETLELGIPTLFLFFMCVMESGDAVNNSRQHISK